MIISPTSDLKTRVNWLWWLPINRTLAIDIQGLTEVSETPIPVIRPENPDPSLVSPPCGAEAIVAESAMIYDGSPSRSKLGGEVAYTGT